MRILFSFAGGHGHFEPLVPIARAVLRAGHEVSFACRASAIAGVTAAGFPASAVGPDIEEPAAVAPLLALDVEREERDFRDYFAGRLAHARAAALIEYAAVSPPDLIVADEADYGAFIAAEHLAIPCASVLVLVAGSFARNATLIAPLNELRAAFGLSPDPALSMLTRAAVFAPFPPSLRDPAYPLPAGTVAIRPGVLDQDDVVLPDWLRERDEPALVYLTLGTVFNMESGDLLQRALIGLRELPADIVVTVGRQLDPASLGPQPANVRVEAFVPQAALLPHCDLVVSHGGSGSVVGSLAYGVPSVLLPMGADQPHNAKRCSELGVAVVLDAVAATPGEIRDAAAVVLADSAMRDRANRVREEAVALPDAAAAVPLIERLVGAVS